MAKRMRCATGFMNSVITLKLTKELLADEVLLQLKVSNEMLRN